MSEPLLSQVTIEGRGKAKERTGRRLSFLETRNHKIKRIRSREDGIIGSEKIVVGRRRGK